MKLSLLALLIATGALMMSVCGCGKPQETHSLKAPPPPPPVVKPDHPLSKAEKIARINASSLPADRKKAEIDKVNAGPD